MVDRRCAVRYTQAWWRAAEIALAAQAVDDAGRHAVCITDLDSDTVTTAQLAGGKVRDGGHVARLAFDFSSSPVASPGTSGV